MVRSRPPRPDGLAIDGAGPASPATPPTDAGGAGDGAAVRRLDLIRLALGAIRLGPGIMLVAAVVAMAFLSPVFMTTRNVGNVLAQTAVIAVLALAQLLVIITRGI